MDLEETNACRPEVLYTLPALDRARARAAGRHDERVHKVAGRSGLRNTRSERPGVVA